MRRRCREDNVAEVDGRFESAFDDASVEESTQERIRRYFWIRLD